MKKVLLTLAIAVSAAAVSFGQGTIVIQNTSTTFAISTNTAAFGSGQSGTSGVTANVANTYFYALLIQTYTGTLTTNNVGVGSNWTFAELGTNVSTGGLKGPGGTAGAAIAGWGAPTGAAYNTGSQDYYVLVGWSANLGANWSTVSAELNSGNWAAQGFFGVSALANGFSGGGPNSLNAPSIWGTGVNAGGLASGFNLFTVGVPEPATMALAGLGGISLLALRRKK